MSRSAASVSDAAKQTGSLNLELWFQLTPRVRHDNQHCNGLVIRIRIASPRVFPNLDCAVQKNKAPLSIQT